MSDKDRYPKLAPTPQSKDVVQVLMTEEMARLFEQRCLGIGNTRGHTSLSRPMFFDPDDLPTYIISVNDPPVTHNQGGSQ